MDWETPRSVLAYNQLNFIMPIEGPKIC